MLRAWPVIIGVLLAGPTAAVEDGMTVADLQLLCRSESPQARWTCRFAIASTLATHDALTADDDKAGAYCPPEPLTPTAAREAFIMWTQRRPQDRYRATGQRALTVEELEEEIGAAKAPAA